MCYEDPCIRLYTYTSLIITFLIFIRVKLVIQIYLFHMMSGFGGGGTSHVSLTYLTFSLPSASVYNWKTGQVMWSSHASVDDHSVHLSQHSCNSFLALVIFQSFLFRQLGGVVIPPAMPHPRGLLVVLLF